MILAHGAGQGMNSPFMNFFHEEMATHGYLSVKFNFDYMERALQKNKFSGMPDPQPKLQATYRQVIEEVRHTHNPKRLIIGGKSMGGRVASYVAATSEEIAGLIFLGYPLHPPGKPDQMRDQHLYSLETPMLFISGTKDTFARRDLLQGVVDRIGKRATLKWIEGGDHSLKVRKGAEASLREAADTIQAWIERLFD